MASTGSGGGTGASTGGTTGGTTGGVVSDYAPWCGHGWAQPCEEDQSLCFVYGDTYSLCTPTGLDNECLLLECPDFAGTPGVCSELYGMCALFCDNADPLKYNCPTSMKCVNTGSYMGCMFDTTL